MALLLADVLASAQHDDDLPAMIEEEHTVGLHQGMLGV
jgi:hypothetical protein